MWEGEEGVLVLYGDGMEKTGSQSVQTRAEAKMQACGWGKKILTYFNILHIISGYMKKTEKRKSKSVPF